MSAVTFWSVTVVSCHACGNDATVALFDHEPTDAERSLVEKEYGFCARTYVAQVAANGPPVDVDNPNR